MSIQREPIFTALFDVLKAIPGIKTASRRVRHWDDVPPTSCPALFQVQKNQAASRTTRTPAKWELDVDVIVYVKTSGNHADTPSTPLNNVLDAIEAALEAKDRSDPRNTLGGLVYDCRIEGVIDTDEGALGETAVAVIPIKIILPA